MEHRGVEYRVLQGIRRGFWKWSVEIEAGTRSGNPRRRSHLTSGGVDAS